jgi:hypothetical protein
MLTLRDAPHSPRATILYLTLVIACSRAIWSWPLPSLATPITSAPGAARLHLPHDVPQVADAVAGRSIGVTVISPAKGIKDNPQAVDATGSIKGPDV